MCIARTQDGVRNIAESRHVFMQPGVLLNSFNEALLAGYTVRKQARNVPADLVLLSLFTSVFQFCYKLCTYYVYV